MTAPEAQEAALICSGKGCRELARWAIVWNNPKIHAPDRRKIWLSCDDHRDHLETFLDARSLRIETVPVDQIEEGWG